MESKKLDAEKIYKDYSAGIDYNNQIKLNDTVTQNENFFIGKQWEGVQSNGLPTPIFNFLKRVVLFQVASILSDNIKMRVVPLAVMPNQRELEQISEIVSNEFDALWEQNEMGSVMREYTRNAAVDGDGCLYTYWDPDVETGQKMKGAIRTEVIENTRVFFGNPNERKVQRQPYITIMTREWCDDVKERAKENGVSGSDLDLIKPDTNDVNADIKGDDNRITVLLRLWKDRKTKTIHAVECVKGLIIRKEWDLGIRLYPLVWLNWDYVQNSYHGQAMITGLIPNQIFVNKTYAMVQLSLMQSAFPKYVYDKTRVSKWSNAVGAAIGVNGGVQDIATIIQPAQISPQISEFIKSTIDYTQTFLGATSAAMGDTRPDNTSAIVALQRASAVPSEMTKQNLYQSVNQLGLIWTEFARVNYGTREVKAPSPDLTGLPVEQIPTEKPTMPFDFSTLKDIPMKLNIDVGAGSYWSEIASMQTLDNLLMNGHIDVVEYLERMPAGYISDKQKLIDIIKGKQIAPQPPGNGEFIPDQSAPEIPLTAGNSALQREIVSGNNALKH